MVEVFKVYVLGRKVGLKEFNIIEYDIEFFIILVGFVECVLFGFWLLGRN